MRKLWQNLYWEHIRRCENNPNIVYLNICVKVRERLLKIRDIK